MNTNYPQIFSLVEQSTEGRRELFMNEVLALVLDFGSKAEAVIRGIRETP